MSRMLDEKKGFLKRTSEAVSQQHVQLQEIKKIRYSEIPEIKKKANEDQSLHNRKVL